MTNLDRLNALLQRENIPAFRKVVSPSFNNLKWLKSTLLRMDCNPELRTLLELPQHQLCQPYIKELFCATAECYATT